MVYRSISILFLASCAAQAVFGQTTPIQIRVQQSSTAATLANGGTITMSAPGVGQVVTATVTLTYAGNTSLALTSAALFGPADFTAGSVSTPVPLPPGGSASFTVRYLPSNSAGASAQVVVGYSEAPPPQTPSAASTAGVITLNLTGVAPEFLVTYAIQANNNVFSVANGGAVLFPNTAVNSASSATISVLNVGSSPGTVQAAAVTGSAFQLQGLPLLPASVAAGRNISFSIVYAPLQVETSLGNLALTLAGQPFSIKLQGSSAAAAFSYQVVGSPTPVDATGITLPDTQVGATSSVTVQVQNTGNGPGQVSSIAATGAGFQVADLPTFPQTLPAGGTLSFTLTFTPTQPGASAGQLRIGNDTLRLTGTGVGPRLTYSYQGGGASTPIVPGGTAFFSPLPVGSTNSLVFTVQNSGNATASASTIGIAEANSPFQVQGFPALPLQLAAGASARFTVTFTPTTVGFANATLRIDAQSFILSGSATSPALLPAYSFSGPTGVVQPQSQLAVGLTLASGYVLPVKGTLSLNAATSTGITDPAVQFASGGTAVAFTIPANSTQAVFANGTTQIQFQTGSVASTLTFSPVFSTAAGFDLTPGSVATLQLTVPAAAPRLTSVQTSGNTGTSLNLIITGVTSTRSLNSLDFTFATAGNFSLRTSRVTVNVALESGTWFASGPSAPFGGQFIISVPFEFTSSNTSVTTPVDAIQSITVSASNAQGASNVVSVNLR